MFYCPDVIPLIIGYLDVPYSLAQCCAVGKTNYLSQCARIHEHWRWHVLQQFGVYYEDYVASINLSHPELWRQLHLYVTQVHANIDKRCVEQRIFRNTLMQPESLGSRQYRGSLELADNGKVFFWENGRHIQIIDVQTGAIRRTIDSGQTFRRYFHRMANSNEKLFICFNERIVCYNIDDESATPIELPMSEVGRGRALELLVHKTRLVLLQANECCMWDVESYKYVCSIRHEFRHRPVDQHHLEVQWMGNAIITWVRSVIRPLQVWSILDGSLIAELHNIESEKKPTEVVGVLDWVQVDIARVTWNAIDIMDHFVIAAMDASAVITLWDSKENYNPIFRFDCGCREPFDLVLSQDFLAVINDDRLTNGLNLTFWKLWLQPGFADIEPQSPSGSARNSEASIQAECEEGRKMRLSSVHEKPCDYDVEKMRLVAKKIKSIDISEVDSYFGSHRNFLNVCSFHKNGLESLSVMQSKTLKKKIFFPPAKVTKFEEWIAIQVHRDGSVILYDFRPNCVAFDDNLRKIPKRAMKTLQGTQKPWKPRGKLAVRV